jgi:hypothetical protein
MFRTINSSTPNPRIMAGAIKSIGFSKNPGKMSKTASIRMQKPKDTRLATKQALFRLGLLMLFWHENIGGENIILLIDKNGVAFTVQFYIIFICCNINFVICIF